MGRKEKQTTKLRSNSSYIKVWLVKASKKERGEESLTKTGSLQNTVGKWYIWTGLETKYKLTATDKILERISWNPNQVIAPSGKRIHSDSIQTLHQTRVKEV